VGRSLRAAVDLQAMPDRTVILDCDVLQADGGTRTASITAAYAALAEALAKLYLTGEIPKWPVLSPVAAISVGIVQGVSLLDLEYVEDQDADVDLNVVGNRDGEYVEVQGTGEGRCFARGELDGLLDLAAQGLEQMFELQERALAPVLQEVESRRNAGRRAAPAKSEKDLWGPP
jgi:ribonuclease PH